MLFVYEYSFVPRALDLVNFSHMTLGHDLYTIVKDHGVQFLTRFLNILVT